MRGSPRSWLSLTLHLLVVLIPSWADGQTSYEVYAVSVADIGERPLSTCVAGVDSSEDIRLHVMMWLLRGPDGRNVLVDAGFHADVPSAEGMSLESYVRPDQAIRTLGISPEEITDIIISHAHWDHVDGVDLFPNARVWIQEAEYRYYTGTAWQPGGNQVGVEPRTVLKLVQLNMAGRLTLVPGDAHEIVEGITVYTGGRHSFAPQYVGAGTESGTVVLASDNVCSYANLERNLPLATTFDREADLAAFLRMRKIAASDHLIIPGHDAAVFRRFHRYSDRIARIR